MKKLTVILILMQFLGCKKKEADVTSVITEKDAYEIINTIFIEQLKSRSGDSTIYWNRRQLKSPPFEYTNDEMGSVSQSPLLYRFSENFWKTDSIKGINVVEWDEYLSFRRNNNSSDLEQRWMLKYSYMYLHNVSYPIFNPNTKIAVLKDCLFRPGLNCGTGLEKLYFYKKTENGWEILNDVR